MKQLTEVNLQLNNHTTVIGVKMLLGIAFICFFFSTNLHCQIPTDGLVAYYPFNGNANDESGNGFNGQVNGATFITDRLGNAVSNSSFFDGTGYISLSDQLDNLMPESFSISVWIKPNSGNSQTRIINNRGGGSIGQVRGYQLKINDSGSGFGLNNIAIDGGNGHYRYCPSWCTTTVYPREWTHIVMIYDYNKSLKVYVDNSLAFEYTSGLGSIGSQSNNSPTVIGASICSSGICNSPSTESQFYKGAIDDIRIYSRVLNTGELTALYQETSPSCTDGIQNADETGIDCGGSCDPCTVSGCIDPNAHNYDPLATTDDGSCQTCIDGTQNGDETDIDCGGSCDPCGTIDLLTDGLVAYYPFNGNANDENPNAIGIHNGIVAGATNANDRFDNPERAYSFNGLSDFIEVPDDPEFNFTSEMSISVWIKPESAGQYNYGRIISKYNGTSTAWDIMLDNSTSNTLLASKMNGTTLRSNPVNIFDGVWHHAVWTYQVGVGVKFYIDNQPAGASTLQTGALNSNTSNLKIGMWPNNNARYFDGAIDDIRLYNVVLTSAEIENLFNEPDPNGSTTTCSDGIQNGDEAGVDCGGSCTPCDTTGNGTSLWTLHNNGSDIFYNDGNVGIGTNSPQSKLAVDGKILAQEVRVKSDISVPDYVFDKDYDLISLGDLKKYINRYSHLPAIPSAGDIKKDGFELGDMDMRLLKKIEELTLYILELKEEVNELNGEKNNNR